DHKLKIPGRCVSGNERLVTAKDFIVFLRRDVTPRYSRNDSPFRKWKLSFAISLDSLIVAQNGADIVEVTFFVGHGNKSPLAVSARNFSYEDWGSFIGISGCVRRESASSSHSCNCKQQKSDLFHDGPLLVQITCADRSTTRSRE